MAEDHHVAPPGRVSSSGEAAAQDRADAEHPEQVRGRRHPADSVPPRWGASRLAAGVWTSASDSKDFARARHSVKLIGWTLTMLSPARTTRSLSTTIRSDLDRQRPQQRGIHDVKIVVLAPMRMASDRTATTLNPAPFRSARTAKTTS